MVQVSFSADQEAQGSGASRGLEEGISSVIERWRNGDVDVCKMFMSTRRGRKQSRLRLAKIFGRPGALRTERKAANWACFDYFFDDEFVGLPGKKFRIRVDSRSARRGILKPGHRWMASIDADDFYNRKKGLQLDGIRFEKLAGYVHQCVSFAK